MEGVLGPVYTHGASFRARAEARQREFRAASVGARHGEYGHLLCREDAEAGANFVHPEACQAARDRDKLGKGVGARTFENMLSSQAMCFNLFAPLKSRPELAVRVLRRFVPGLAALSAIAFEHTPERDVFNDQSGHGGVDCDLMVEGALEGGRSVVLIVETKFVEPEFSVCGFRKPGRAKKEQDVCPDDVPVRDDRSQCLYVANKRYRYWQRSDELRVLADDAVPHAGCPFGGAHWQLWVNLVLAHVEAAKRGAVPLFAVCAPVDNKALLRDGTFLDGFRALASAPGSVLSLPVDELVEAIESEAPPDLRSWSQALRQRYAGI